MGSLPPISPNPYSNRLPDGSHEAIATDFINESQQHWGGADSAASNLVDNLRGLSPEDQKEVHEHILGSLDQPGLNVSLTAEAYAKAIELGGLNAGGELSSMLGASYDESRINGFSLSPLFGLQTLDQPDSVRILADVFADADRPQMMRGLANTLVQELGSETELPFEVYGNLLTLAEASVEAREVLLQSLWENPERRAAFVESASQTPGGIERVMDLLNSVDPAISSAAEQDFAEELFQEIVVHSANFELNSAQFEKMTEFINRNEARLVEESTNPSGGETGAISDSNNHDDGALFVQWQLNVALNGGLSDGERKAAADLVGDIAVRQVATLNDPNASEAEKYAAARATEHLLDSIETAVEIEQDMIDSAHDRVANIIGGTKNILGMAKDVAQVVRGFGDPVLGAAANHFFNHIDNFVQSYDAYHRHTKPEAELKGNAADATDEVLQNTPETPKGDLATEEQKASNELLRSEIDVFREVGADDLRRTTPIGPGYVTFQAEVQAAIADPSARADLLQQLWEDPDLRAELVGAAFTSGDGLMEVIDLLNAVNVDDSVQVRDFAEELFQEVLYQAGTNRLSDLEYTGLEQFFVTHADRILDESTNPAGVGSGPSNAANQDDHLMIAQWVRNVGANAGLSDENSSRALAMIPAMAEVKTAESNQSPAGQTAAARQLAHLEASTVVAEEALQSDIDQGYDNARDIIATLKNITSIMKNTQLPSREIAAGVDLPVQIAELAARIRGKGSNELEGAAGEVSGPAGGLTESVDWRLQDAPDDEKLAIEERRHFQDRDRFAGLDLSDLRSGPPENRTGFSQFETEIQTALNDPSAREAFLNDLWSDPERRAVVVDAALSDGQGFDQLLELLNQVEPGTSSIAEQDYAEEVFQEILGQVAEHPISDSQYQLMENFVVANSARLLNEATNPSGTEDGGISDVNNSDDGNLFVQWFTNVVAHPSLSEKASEQAGALPMLMAEIKLTEANDPALSDYERFKATREADLVLDSAVTAESVIDDAITSGRKAHLNVAGMGKNVTAILKDIFAIAAGDNHQARSAPAVLDFFTQGYELILRLVPHRANELEGFSIDYSGLSDPLHENASSSPVDPDEALIREKVRGVFDDRLDALDRKNYNL